jgi:hypothetical protein
MRTATALLSGISGHGHWPPPFNNTVYGLFPSHHDLLRCLGPVPLRLQGLCRSSLSRPAERLPFPPELRALDVNRNSVAVWDFRAWPLAPLLSTTLYTAYTLPLPGLCRSRATQRLLFPRMRSRPSRVTTTKLVAIVWLAVPVEAPAIARLLEAWACLPARIQFLRLDDHKDMSIMHIRPADQQHNARGISFPLKESQRRCHLRYLLATSKCPARLRAISPRNLLLDWLGATESTLRIQSIDTSKSSR